MSHDPVPDPSGYRGVRLRQYLEDVAAWARRNRVITDPSTGLIQEQVAGGLLLRLLATLFRFRMAKADHGSILPQSSGTVTLYTDIKATALTDPPAPLAVWNPFHVRSCPSGSLTVLILTVAGVSIIIGWEC